MDSGEQHDQPGPDQADASRSGGIFLTPHEPRGWTGDWYACPKAGCDYQERTASDGTLGQEYCPRHGEVLTRVTPPG